MTMADLNEMTERRGLQALQYWCQKATTGYHGVRVSDMSSSWRDGLAFCALIHHYRPDLIDFESLQASNILENNQLAFRVAEEQLGIPALLDAEDMVKYQVPDRLSIATYVSQFYQYFEGGMSRIKSTTSAPQNCVPPAANNFNIGPPTKKSVLVHSSNCRACLNKVFLLERLIVGTKLYHRSCFRCCRCDTILNPGAYALADDCEDKYECTVCPKDEGPEFKKILLKSEIGITRRRVESFGSETSSASSDSRPPSSTSNKQIDAIREFAGTSSSGSEPELTRLKETKLETERPEVPKSPIPSTPQKTITSARFKPSTEKPAVAVKPIALVAGTQKHVEKDVVKPISKVSRSPSPTKSLKEPSLCLTPDFSKLRENLRKTPTEADPLPVRRLSIGSRNNEQLKTFDERLKELSLKSSVDSSAFQRTSSLRHITPERLNAFQTDSRVKSLNSIDILPDKPKPAPRKLDDTSNLSPLAGRRSVSPNSLNIHYNATEAQATSPVPMPRRKTPVLKVEPSEPVLVDSKPEEESVSINQPDKSPGPPKPRRGVVRKSIKSPPQKQSEPALAPAIIEYPSDLNPFGEDDDEALDAQQSLTVSKETDETKPETKKEYPDDLNPFGEDEDEQQLDNEETTSLARQPSLSHSGRSSQISMASQAYDDSLNPFFDASMTPSLKKSPKKKAAPLPPSKPSSTSLTSMNSVVSSSASIQPPSKSSVTPEQVVKPSVAAPEPPQARRKKRPAPGVPVPMKRELQAVSLKAIQGEMKTIEKRQLELEVQGRNIELKLRELHTPSPDEKDGPKSDNQDEDEPLMMQLFELVNEKNALYRRQAELMYIKRYQRLEEEQIECEYEIRLLLNKPPSQKTAEDEEREAQLIQRLVEVVELRNEIIDAQEMDRQRLTKEDEDIEAQRAKMNSRGSGASEPLTSPVQSKKKDKKAKKDKKDKSDSSKKTLKKLFKEKYKTLKHGATLKKA